MSSIVSVACPACFTQSFAEAIVKTDATTDRNHELTVHPPVEEVENKEAVSESDLRTNGAGNGGGGDVLRGFLGLRGRRHERGRHEALSQGAVRGSSGNLYSCGIDNDDDNDAADGGNDENGGAHSARTADDVGARREIEGISVGPAASAGPATALQLSNDADEEDVDIQPQLGACHVAGVASVAASSAGEMMDRFPGRIGLSGSPESPRQDGAGHATGGGQGDQEGAGTSEEAVQGAGSASENGELGIETAVGSMATSYAQGAHSSAPLISAIVGGSNLGDDVDRVAGGERDATDAAPTTPSPLPTSWLDRVVYTTAVRLVRRWLTYPDAAVGNPPASAPRIINSDEEERGCAPTARRGMRMGAAGWRSPPTVSPFKGDFNERVEDWRVRLGYRRSR